MIPRVLILEKQKDIIQQLKEIGVDKGGISIMAPKADFFVVKLDKLPWFAANILKQEMLSLGAEVAISRWSLTGKQKTTPCLLMGNRAQFDRLIDKMKKQPFQLNQLSQILRRTLSNYSKDNFVFKCGKFNLKKGKRTLLMGIINATEDSFSGDGVLREISRKNLTFKNVVIDKAERMVGDGADIIDIGAESSRPGAKPISTKEEIMRLLPCVKALSKKIKIPVSVDTYKPEVAKVVLDAGASIINDITGLRNHKMRRLIKQYGAGAIIMHMQGAPRTMQKKPHYVSLINEIIFFLRTRIDEAKDSGISLDQLVVDPGIGFGKTVQHNLAIINNLGEFKVLGRPILMGVSRKSFIGAVTKRDVSERLFGTAASVAISALHGADIVRVHDIRQMQEVVRICDAVNQSNGVAS